MIVLVPVDQHFNMTLLGVDSTQLAAMVIANSLALRYFCAFPLSWQLSNLRGSTLRGRQRSNGSNRLPLSFRLADNDGWCLDRTPLSG